MSEEPTQEPSVAAQFTLVTTTQCDHEWQLAGEDPTTGLSTYVCTKCWSGKNSR